ncbi:hypothetical protein V494_07500 [Pseudogymnoascus sp. VKM F-4513 (FW-928)]|nr:hypothetical protein V494_07500 [Pseudogymnoascus sp. VKM F-4513 (FW-928)]
MRITNDPNNHNHNRQPQLCAGCLSYTIPAATLATRRDLAVKSNVATDAAEKMKTLKRFMSTATDASAAAIGPEETE